jgi:hypothetical protein
VVDCTWANMLEHFQDAQADLSTLPTAADVYHQQPPHQANVVTSMADLVAQRLLDAMPPTEEPTAEHTELANAIQQRESDLQARETAMHTQMQEMMALMLICASSSNSTNRNRSSSYNRGQGRGNNPNTDRGRPTIEVQDEATIATLIADAAVLPTNAPTLAITVGCWSHGACAHIG